MRRGILALLLCLFAAPVAAQNHYALEILSPKAVAAAPTGLDANNRVFWAYPGLEYNIRVAAIGGRYPYTYSLSGEPAGMSITAGPCTVIGPTCTAGTITWTPADATSDDASITVEVCDADNDCTSETWGIDVVDPATQTRFRFLDAVNGSDAAAGTLAAPWQTLDAAYDSSGANSICVLRSGTYTPAGLPVSNADDATGEERVEWNASSRCAIFIAYPGESPVIDFEYTGDGCGTSPATYDCGQSVPRFRMSGTAIYIDGITTTRSMVMAFQMSRNSNRGVMVRRSTMANGGPGRNGSNSAFVMWIATYGGGGTPGTQTYGDVVQNSAFSVVTDSDALKAYSWTKGLIADNSFTSLPGVESVALKSDVSQFTVRGNTFTDATLGGNQDSHNTGEETYGEIAYNLFTGTATNYIGESRVDCCIGAFYVYRNTFAGTAPIIEALDTGDGPWNFTDNIIVNAVAASGSCPAKFTCSGVLDYSRLVLTTNLTGVAADGILDGSGALQGSYRTTYLGTRGYELSAADPVTPRLKLKIRGESVLATEIPDAEQAQGEPDGAHTHRSGAVVNDALNPPLALDVDRRIHALHRPDHHADDQNDHQDLKAADPGHDRCAVGSRCIANAARRAIRRSTLSIADGSTPSTNSANAISWGSVSPTVAVSQGVIHTRTAKRIPVEMRA